jgi:hypothetical protein
MAAIFIASRMPFQGTSIMLTSMAQILEEIFELATAESSRQT